MSRIAYVNGRYSAHSRASIHIDDRAHTFADGVYEVILVVNRHMIDLDDHFRRLDRSLTELDIPRPMTERVLTHIMNRTIHLNRVVDGIVYLQISRGAAPRNHVFDNASLTPGVVCTARRLTVPATSRDISGVEVITLRVVASAGIGALSWPEAPQGGGRNPEDALLYRRATTFDDGRAYETPRFDRSKLKGGQLIDGPAIVIQTDSTTLVPPGYEAMVAPSGNLHVREVAES